MKTLTLHVTVLQFGLTIAPEFAEVLLRSIPHRGRALQLENPASGDSVL